MEAKSRCSKCGALLPSDGQCVNCLLQLGMAPDKPNPPGVQPDPSQPLSPALQLAWQIAVGEARKTHHRSVEPEHFFAGLCKVLSIVQGGKLRVAPEVSVALRSEAEALAQVLSRFPVHYVSLYRQWRAQLGPGDALHPNGTKISRSAVSRALFGRAVELAGGDPTLTTLHLLKAMLADDQAPLARWLREQEPRGEAREAEAAPEPIAPIRPQGGPAFALHPLHRFGKDLIQLAREGKVQECIGRRQELLQVIRTLARDTRNNPLLVGDAGVGKTAIVEGLARCAPGQLTRSLTWPRSSKSWRESSFLRHRHADWAAASSRGTWLCPNLGCFGRATDEALYSLAEAQGHKKVGLAPTRPVLGISLSSLGPVKSSGLVN